MAKSSSNRQNRGLGRTAELGVRFTSGGRQLSPAQRDTIEHRLKENRKYVDHPSFSESGSDRMCLDEACVPMEPESEASVSSALAGVMTPFSHLLSKEEEKDLERLFGQE